MLGVERHADADAIKRAYRRLAMKYHPDRNAGDSTAEKKFKEVQEAYSCLSDAEKRAAYDRFGHAAFDGGMGGGGGGGAEFSHFFDNVFSEFFGGGGGRSSRQQQVLDIELSLEEMAEGCRKDIRLTLPQDCDSCKGSGGAPGFRLKVCPTCGGDGQVRVQSGFFSVQQTCRDCRGAGRAIDKPCAACGGKGKVRKPRRLSVNIPAGIEDGTLLRINANGNGSGSDILLRPSAKSHPLFTRRGDDLHIEIPLTISTAALGGEINVPSLKGGRIQVSIPPGIQSGQILRVAQRGVPNVHSRRRGSLMCHILVETPVNLSKKQKELLREFESSLKDNSPKEKSWLEKAKALFSE